MEGLPTYDGRMWFKPSNKIRFMKVYNSLNGLNNLQFNFILANSGVLWRSIWVWLFMRLRFHCLDCYPSSKARQASAFKTLNPRLMHSSWRWAGMVTTHQWPAARPVNFNVSWWNILSLALSFIPTFNQSVNHHQKLIYHLYFQWHEEQPEFSVKITLSPTTNLLTKKCSTIDFSLVPTK